MTTYEKINKILLSNPDLNYFISFLSIQEIDRMTDVLFSAMADLDSNFPVNGTDYTQWSVAGRARLLKELSGALPYFGFVDLVSRFPTDVFLQAYFQSVN